MNGLLSPLSTIIFPLRPDVCVYIKPKTKSQKELYTELKEEHIEEINAMFLKNSYECVVSKDKECLENLTKTYNHKSHKKSRDAVVYENGSYTMFNME